APAQHLLRFAIVCPQTQDFAPFRPQSCRIDTYIHVFFPQECENQLTEIANRDFSIRSEINLLPHRCRGQGGSQETLYCISHKSKVSCWLKGSEHNLFAP